jgi:hypothetical protein
MLIRDDDHATGEAERHEVVSVHAAEARKECDEATSTSFLSPRVAKRWLEQRWDKVRENTRMGCGWCHLLFSASTSVAR